jgi:hypothetical protein
VGATAPTAHDGATDHGLDDDHHGAPADDDVRAGDNDVDHDTHYDDVPGAAGATDDHHHDCRWV